MRLHHRGERIEAGAVRHRPANRWVSRSSSRFDIGVVHWLMNKRCDGSARPFGRPVVPEV